MTSHSVRASGGPPAVNRRPRALRALLVTCRPRQWVKNTLVFAAPGTAGVLLEPVAFSQSMVAFVAFCAASSGMYCINDVKDRARDAAHPEKRGRPVAAGDLGVGAAWAAGVTLALTAVLVAAIGPGLPLAAAVCAYLALALAYTYYLRDVVILDVVAVAATFVIRAAAGGLAVGVYLSSWFLMVATFGALFVAVGKRLAEYRVLGTTRATHRQTLDDYSEPLLRSMSTSASTVAITAYVLWAFEGEGSRNVMAAMSILPFVLGIYRYAQLAEAGAGGSPEEIAMKDRFLQLTCLVWLSCVAASVYFQ